MILTHPSRPFVHLDMGEWVRVYLKQVRQSPYLPSSSPSSSSPSSSFPEPLPLLIFFIPREAVRSLSWSRVAEAVAAVPVEVIPAERQSGTHRSRHLARFHLKRPSPEIHLRFAQRVELRVKPMQKTFVYDLKINEKGIARPQKSKNHQLCTG